MKYFIDTEFIEGFYKPTFGKKRHFVDLISIGIVAEDGRKFYQISCEYNYNDADAWVKENVILPIYKQIVSGDMRNRFSVDNFHKHFGLTNKQIADSILEFINPSIQDLIVKFTRHDCWLETYYPNEFEYIRKHNTKIPDTYYKSGSDGYVKNRALIYNQPEFYAYYADYDWVVFCSLFGRMIDLPKGFPMYCRDLKQSLDEKLMQEYPINGTKVTLLNSTLDAKYIVELRAMKTLKEKLDWIKKYCYEYPSQQNEHNALDDANWNKKLFDFIDKL